MQDTTGAGAFSPLRRVEVDVKGQASPPIVVEEERPRSPGDEAPAAPASTSPAAPSTSPRSTSRSTTTAASVALKATLGGHQNVHAGGVTSGSSPSSSSRDVPSISTTSGGGAGPEAERNKAKTKTETTPPARTRSPPASSPEEEVIYDLRDFPTDWGYVIPEAPAIRDMDPEFVFSCPSSNPLKNNRVVQADVKRTRAALPQIVAQHGRLETLITNYCQATDTFYRQGLNEILAPFVLLEPVNDLKVLIKFHGFFSRFCAPFFAEGFTQMEAVLRSFDSLILYHFPDLHQELAINDLEPVVYATPWFVTLFASKLDDLRDVVRLWKFYCIRNDPAYVAFIGLAMLKRAKAEILKCDVSALPGLLASLTPLPVEDVFLVADELYQQTPPLFATHIRYQLPWQSPLPPTGDPLDPRYLEGWDFAKAAEEFSEAEDYGSYGGMLFPGGAAAGSTPSGNSLLAGSSSAASSLMSAGATTATYSAADARASSPVGGTSRVVGLTATEALQMLGGSKKRVHELQMMLIDDRPLQDFEDNGRLPSAIHCEDALTLHKMFAENLAELPSTPSRAAGAVVETQTQNESAAGSEGAALVEDGSSASRGRADDEAANAAAHNSANAVKRKGNLHPPNEMEGGSASSTGGPPPPSPSASSCSRLRNRKVHLCLISKKMAYEAAFRYQIPFVSYVRGGYAALHDQALAQKMEMINHDREKCYWCAPAWKQQAHSWKNWLFGAAPGGRGDRDQQQMAAAEDVVQWPVQNHEAQWRCRSGGCPAAVVTTADNLLYLVEIDPEGQRVGAYVRVISKYPVFMISKITSKKSAREPTRCFYFKDADASSRKPYLGFSVTFDSEETARSCTTKVGECCRRACDENG
mmetsp:Transcript_17409/g.43356  ORF Transcript_17409/g.43356 Transcript_17409/m.43356 type:complete len:868 (-) Transcript_17409:431-3034(-)